jgi:hypothetical protein
MKSFYDGKHSNVYKPPPPLLFMANITCKHCGCMWQTKSVRRNVTCPNCIVKTPNPNFGKDEKELKNEMEA